MLRSFRTAHLMEPGQLRRREFITLLGGTAAWPLAARAQQVAKIPRIGIIDPAGTWHHFFRQGLLDLGYIEGRNIALNIDLRKDGLSGSWRPRRS